MWEPLTEVNVRTIDRSECENHWQKWMWESLTEVNVRTIDRSECENHWQKWMWEPLTEVEETTSLYCFLLWCIVTWCLLCSPMLTVWLCLVGGRGRCSVVSPPGKGGCVRFKESPERLWNLTFLGHGKSWNLKCQTEYEPCESMHAFVVPC